MNEKRRYGILWGKSLAGLAACVWGVATYIGLLFGAVVFGVMFAKGTSRPDISAAVAGVFLATVLNWMVFGMVEHGHIKRMNDEQ